MAQTSTSILSTKSHIADVTGTDISFNATGSTYKITSTDTSLSGFAVRDLITVTGTTNNNSTFTVKEVTDANNVVVEELVTTETSDGSTTITLDHTGFVSDKQKGDGGGMSRPRRKRRHPNKGSIEDECREPQNKKRTKIKDVDSNNNVVVHDTAISRVIGSKIPCVEDFSGRELICINKHLKLKPIAARKKVLLCVCACHPKMYTIHIIQ